MVDPLLLGIEIGGTKLQLGLGRGDGHILALRRLNVVPDSGAEAIREQIAESIEPLLAMLRATRTAIQAAGIGFGGPVDVDRGVVITSNQVSGWNNFSLGDWAH